MLAQKMAGPQQKQPEEKTAKPGMAAQNMPEEGEQATPEENDAIERTVYAAGKVLYGKQTHDQIVKGLADGADNPGKALGDTTMSVMQILDQKSGGKIPAIALIHGAMQVLDLVGELAAQSGAFPTDEQVMQSGMQNLVKSAIEMGIIDPQEVQELIDSMDPAEVQQLVAQQEQIAGGQPQEQQAAPQSGGMPA